MDPQARTVIEELVADGCALGSGAKGELARVLGASASNLGVEVGWKSVPRLPDVSVRRYGRPSLA